MRFLTCWPLDSAGCVRPWSQGAVRVPGRGEATSLPLAENVLVARSEMEQQKSRLAELASQLADSAAAGEYQLKLQGLAQQRALRDAAEAAAELAAAAQKRCTLRAVPSSCLSRGGRRGRAAAPLLELRAIGVGPAGTMPWQRSASSS